MGNGRTRRDCIGAFSCGVAWPFRASRMPAEPYADMKGIR